MSYDYQTADPSLYKLLHEHATHNRNNPTEAEALLWEYLKADGLGVAFKRQHIIGDFIVDFVCIPSKLIVELDGGYHQTTEQQVIDDQRSKWLEGRGFKVIRFTNEELFHGVDTVLNTIVENL